MSSHEIQNEQKYETKIQLAEKCIQTNLNAKTCRTCIFQHMNFSNSTSRTDPLINFATAEGRLKMLLFSNLLISPFLNSFFPQ